MERITKKVLEAKIERLNWLTQGNREGEFRLSQAYGGYNLHLTVGEDGGVANVLSCGHIPARRLADMIDAFTIGIGFQKGRG